MPAHRELVAPRLGTKTCGGVVYHRFSTPVAELLEEGGHWIISRRRGSSALCLPDNGSLPRVRMQVPGLDELLGFAAQVHERREPYEGSMWGWPVRYTPCAFGHVVTNEECPRLARPTRLEIGVPGLWRAIAEWTSDEPVVWVEDDRRGAESGPDPGCVLSPARKAARRHGRPGKLRNRTVPS